MNFIYTVNADSDEPVMLINKHIGCDEADGEGILGDVFHKEMMALDAMHKKRIQVWINSPGGLVTDGYDIYNAILRTQTRVDTRVTGMACSIAAVIFQAGHYRTMCDYGILMFHNPYAPDGSSTPLTAIMTESIATMIEARCNMPATEVQSMMDRTTFMDAPEALRLGLCDAIEPSGHLNKPLLAAATAATSPKAYWKQANHITNKLFEKNNMKKVANKLGLTGDADEQLIVDAINAMQNKLKDAGTLTQKKEEEMAALKAALDTKQAELDALKNEYEKMKNDMEETDRLKARAEDETRTEKARTLVNSLAPGRIKNDAPTIAKWVSMAKADYDGTKALLEGIALNKNAARFTGNDAPGNDGGGTPLPTGYTAIGVMAKIQAAAKNKR